MLLLFKNKKNLQFIFITATICSLGAGILFSGNRMPFILFLFGLSLFFLFNFKIKKILVFGIINLIVLLLLIFNFNEKIKANYVAFFNHASNIMTMRNDQVVLEILGSNQFTDGDVKKKDFENDPVEFQETTRSKRIISTIVWESNHRRLFSTCGSSVEIS